MGSLTVTLPDEVIDEIRDRVAAGDYASESELVRDALRSAMAEDPILEAWLDEVVAPRCRDRATRTAALIPAEEVVERVQRRFAAPRR